MQHLEAVFHLRAPVALGAPWIFFDSLLMHAKLREELGERYFSLPTKLALKLGVDIPVKRWNDVYVASVSIFEPENVNMYVFQYFKRGDFPFTKGKISRGSGFFKDFYLKVVYAPALRVRFYATGELEEVRRLASRISALGKERNIGFGLVKEVVVREVGGEWGLVKDGVAMRPIPVRYLKSYEDAAVIAYKPPYWDKGNMELCAVPFTRVELK
jgi:hypothetical protein